MKKRAAALKIKINNVSTVIIRSPETVGVKCPFTQQTRRNCALLQFGHQVADEDCVLSRNRQVAASFGINPIVADVPVQPLGG